jgi:hypothetical protein
MLSVAAMLQAHVPMHLVRLDALCDDERFKRAVAITAGAWYMQPSESSRMRQDGELDLSRSRSRADEQSRPALCPGSAWGFALLRAVLEGGMQPRKVTYQRVAAERHGKMCKLKCQLDARSRARTPRRCSCLERRHPNSTSKG